MHPVLKRSQLAIYRPKSRKLWFPGLRYIELVFYSTTTLNNLASRSFGSIGMNHLGLGFALTILALAGNAQSAPVTAPQAEVVGHLAAAFATHDPARITHAYRAMGDYALPAADIVEATINAMG
jgi:hypothetical protein